MLPDTLTCTPAPAPAPVPVLLPAAALRRGDSIRTTGGWAVLAAEPDLGPYPVLALNTSSGIRSAVVAASALLQTRPVEGRGLR